jgi:hypothetical protein
MWRPPEVRFAYGYYAMRSPAARGAEQKPLNSISSLHLGEYFAGEENSQERRFTFFRRERRLLFGFLGMSGGLSDCLSAVAAAGPASRFVDWFVL